MTGRDSGATYDNVHATRSDESEIGLSLYRFSLMWVLSAAVEEASIRTGLCLRGVLPSYRPSTHRLSLALGNSPGWLNRSDGCLG